MRTIISNGTNRFHLSSLAASLGGRGALAGFITAGWPTRGQRRLVQVLGSRSGWERFLDRAEPIDDRLVYSSFYAEILNQGARLFRGRWARVADAFERATHAVYSSQATRVVRKIKPEIYHFRSCFGLASVPAAKQEGAVTICDHSIAHPRVLDYLVRNGGHLPPPGENGPTTQLERWMMTDLNQADHVLVNSDFVKETCLVGGMAAERIHVIYWGIDDKFLELAPAINPGATKRYEHKGALFAGKWEQRKGASTLLEAFGLLKPTVTLEIAGDVDPKLAGQGRMAEFLAGDRVVCLGALSRRALATKMSEHAVFVFPTLCEGSARVVFEALACGCYVITTKNAGSIVEDGVHGRIIEPGQPKQLAAALDEALANPRRMAEIGCRNAQLVREFYSQKTYSANVELLYRRLVAERFPRPGIC